jgi:catechol 2,3-dioxygenase-like lactoylglutathione lyase family enzyme
MSYVALVTDRYDEMVRFYGDDLGFEVVRQWDRPGARGLRFDLEGLRLELIDNRRERSPLSLGTPADRFHVVVEVDDIEAARQRVNIDAPPAQSTSWGADIFEFQDPDGIRVTFLQWTDGQGDAP